MKSIKLPYGKNGINLILHKNIHWQIIRRKKMPIIERPENYLLEAMNNPLGIDPLYIKAKNKKNACIVISDTTRPVPNKIILPPLLKVLKNAGMKKENITILIATGLHRMVTPSEIDELLGKNIAMDYKIINHEARNNNYLLYLGRTSKSTPVFINKIYQEAQLKIITGLIEPHFMSGYSGGRKAICPGISGEETILHQHSPKFLESPYARNCQIKNNPFHEEAEEIAKMAGCDFLINAVIDEDRNISGIFCGDFIKAFSAGFKFAEKYSKINLAEKFDIIITTTAGYPLDRTYYQTVKGLVAALEILNQDGIIIMASECCEGLGSKDFIDLLKELKNYNDYNDFISKYSRRKNFKIDQWEVEELIKVLKKARIFLFSPKLAKEDFNLTFAQRINSIEKGISLALKEYSHQAKIAIVPEGPYLIPFFQ